MGLSIYLFAGPSDYRALSAHCRSIGLNLFPIREDQPEESPSDDPASYPFAYLTPLSRDQLHPYGNPRGIGPATDPLLELMKPYYKDSTLVVGSVYCSNDVGDLFSVTKPYFVRIAKWIKAYCKQLPTGQYIGPEAAELASNGARLAFIRPGIEIEVRKG